jgi:PKD repeat protein
MSARSYHSCLLGIIAALLSAAGAPAAPPRLAPHPRLPLAFQPGQVIVSDVPAGATAAGGTWAESIGGAKDDDASVIRETSDSGLIFSGTNTSVVPDMQKLWIFKTDAAGVKQWEKVIGAGTTTTDYGQVLPLSDGGYSFSVDSFDQSATRTATIFGKLDANINIVWQKQITGTGQVPDTVYPFSDGSFLISGSNSTFMGSGIQVVEDLVRVSSSGSIMWQQEFPTASELGQPYLESDGKLLFVGSVVTVSPTFEILIDGLVTLVGSNGVPLWQKTLVGPGSDSLIFSVPYGGGYLAVGNTTSWGAGGTNGDVWLVQLDSSGNIQKQLAIGDTQSDFGVPEIIDGTLYLIGTTFTTSVPNGGGFIAQLDSSLNPQSSKVFSIANQQATIEPIPDGSGRFLIEGTVKSGNGTNDIVLAQVDSSGTQIWGRRIGGPEDESGFGLREGSSFLATGVSATALADANIILSGFTRSFGAGGSDALLAKLDPTGQLPGCSLVQNLTVTATPWTPQVTPTTATVTTTVPTATTPAFSLVDGTLTVTNASSTVGAICNAAPALTASATADKTSGTAPVTVNFTGSASNGTGPYTYEWDFGDGSAHSTQQNPAHTYTSAGSYSVTLTVTDSTAKTAIDNHLTITVTGGACTVGCTATVPATGTANQAVSFAATASASNCGGSPTYAWTFGDGGTSSQQNPSHTYAAAGTYDWTLTVTAGSGNCSKSGSITIGTATCTVTCSATVPTTGTAGQAVAFAASASPSNCAGSPFYAWTFGDGQTSTQQNPPHTYAAAGAYHWTLTVSAGTATCSKNGTITVSAAPAAATYWVPSVAHAPGAGTSKWRSNIAAVNRSGAAVHLTLAFVPYASGANVTRTYTLANGATVEWADVLVSLFGFADSANTKGTVKITSDGPIYATSRTYNQAASGTFGQYYPALTQSESISGSQAAVLPLLKKNSAFRTNVGFQNLTSASCSGEIKLFNATGAQVGSTRTLTAAADKYIQDDDVFAKAAAGTQDVAYARVQATTSGCKAWFYGSVIDAVTNDPTTVPQILSVAGPYWVPSIAHAPGAGTSKWRSNIAVVNRAGPTANLTLDFVPYASGATVTRTYALANNHTVEWADVLVSLFGFADSANTKGTVKITANVPLFAVSRTYNQATSGTFGQYYPALVGASGVTSGHPAVLPLLKKSSAFRTNVGFENLGAASCTGTIKLYSAVGAQVGSTRTLTAGLDKYIQDDDVFTKAGAGNQEPAYAVVDVTTSGGTAWFYGSVIDAVTNDPTTVPQQP